MYCSSPFLGDMLVFRGVQNDVFGCLLNILSPQNRIINPVEWWFKIGFLLTMFGKSPESLKTCPKYLVHKCEGLLQLMQIVKVHQF